MRKQMVYIDGSTLSLRCCGCFRRALLPESREVARGGSATSRRSFSSNFVPTPRWRRLWAGSEYVGGLETEQGAGRRGCMRPLDAQHGTAGGATEATLRRWGVCDGVWKGVGVWKGCEGRRRGTCLSVDNRTRGLAAPWWGGSRRERQPSHHGAFGRLSILSGILSSSGAPASNPAPPLSHMRPQLPQSSLLTTYLRSPPRPLLVCLCMCSVRPFLWHDSSPYEQRRCRERERRRGTRRPPFRRARRVLCAAVAHAPSLPRILLPATLARVHTLTTCAHMTGTRLVLAASRPGHAQGVARGRGPRGAQSSHSSRG